MPSASSADLMTLVSIVSSVLVYFFFLLVSVTECFLGQSPSLFLQLFNPALCVYIYYIVNV